MGRLSSRNACLNCRHRHLKCDEQLPSCLRCHKAKLSCTHGLNVKFQHFNGQRIPQRINSDHQWEKSKSMSYHASETISRTNVFINETSSVIQSYGKRAHEIDQNHRNDSNERPNDATMIRNHVDPDELSASSVRFNASIAATAHTALSPSAALCFDNPPAIFGLPLAGNIYNFLQTSTSTDLHPLQMEEPTPDMFENSVPFNELENRLTSSSEAFPPPIIRPQRHNALESLKFSSNAKTLTAPDCTSHLHSREAHLLKFFTQTWGPIFDCLDPDSTFSKSVLHMALTGFQPLLYAMFAISALQLSRVSNYPFLAAENYRSQCSKLIMPILLSQDTQGDHGEEELFATYVLLRSYEHMMDNINSREKEGLFTATLAIYSDPSGSSSKKAKLARAAFWVHLRQDIHVALLLQCPIRTDYCPCLRREGMLAELDRPCSSQNAIDCAWANRMVSLTCDIINYCFDEDEKSVDEWLILGAKLERWNVEKPVTFRPFCERERDIGRKRVFPEIWLASDCHVIAFLYYHISKILLKTQRPGAESCNIHVPSGLECREEALFHARAICGIVITNPIAQALIIACHMVNVSAIYFSSELEQHETIRLLRMAESMTGHPCERTVRRLREVWGRSYGD